MFDLLLLCDYKGFFGSKNSAKPYRSGMDKNVLTSLLMGAGYNVIFKTFAEINFRNSYENQIVLYTSSEDANSYYKGFIEDIVFGFELAGATVIPSYKFLRATDNKVFMEILRDLTVESEFKTISSYYFGSFEEFEKTRLDEKEWVYKTSSGAQGRGVGIGHGKGLVKGVKKISKSKSLIPDLKDLCRVFKHKGYITNSKYRNKFIIQNFVPNLEFDYKVLVFADKFFVLRRNNRPNDFRASGSGNFIFEPNVPSEILTFAKKVSNTFSVPNISLDIAFTNNIAYLIEFQCVYYGSTTVDKAPFYFVEKPSGWETIYEKSEIEYVYASSIIKFLESGKNKP